MIHAEPTSKPAQKAVESLRTNLKGLLILPGDPAYDGARTVWNKMIDRYPAFIVKCAVTNDVIAAIRFAREHSLPVAIKGGGHNVAGNAICDDGLVIDLSKMNTVQVDAEKKTAHVEAGCLLGDMDRATQAYGLALPAGIMSETGVAGLTLGGGLGWLSRKYGLTIDSLLSAELITAQGQQLTVSKKEHPDLFWGIRGGGGNFGVVTSFEFQLYDVGPEVYSGLIVHPFSEAKEVLAFHREFVTHIPDELSAWIVIRKAPPLPFLPPEAHGQLVVIVAFCYAGSQEEGERLMAAHRTLGKPHGEHVGMHPYAGWQTTIDPLQAHGARNYWKSHNLKDLNEACMNTILEYAEKLPSPHTEILIPHLQGAIARVPNDATAYAHRQVPYLLNIHGRWETPEEDDQCIQWTKDLFDAVTPYSTGGVYVNFISQEGDERVQDAYLESWDRLVALKNKYDPENFFRMNQNISPKSHQYK